MTSHIALVASALDALLARRDYDFKLEATPAARGVLVRLEERRCRKEFTTIKATATEGMACVLADALKWLADDDERIVLLADAEPVLSPLRDTRPDRPRSEVA